MKNLKKLVCVGVVTALGFNAVAISIYDTGSSYNGNLMQQQNLVELGNEISLHTGGMWSLTNFGFEYYSPQASFTPSLGVDVRFYLNDGAKAGGYPTPGTLFYDSGFFYNSLGGIPSGGVAHDLNYTSADLYSGPGVNLPPGFLMPAEFTFTITWINMGTNVIYVPLANNMATSFATNYGTYWRNSGSWALLTNSVPANFVVKFEGVPEPSILGLGALGGALLLGINKLRRKR